MDALTVSTCRNCGNTFPGKFCTECGEKKYAENEKTLSHLWHETLHFITHFDHKIFRTTGLILTKPGYVSNDYCEGKRQRYYKPMSLFLVCVILYLLFPLLQGMNLTLASHISNNRSLGIRFPRDWALYKLQAQHLSEQQLMEKFAKVSKIMLLVLIPMTAVSLSVLFRNKKKYIYDHYILAAEFNTFYLLVIFFILPLSVSGVTRLFNMQNNIADSWWALP